MLTRDNIANTNSPPQPRYFRSWNLERNIEFTVGELAGYFSRINSIWTSQKCCFWIRPIQGEQSKATAITQMVITSATSCLAQRPYLGQTLSDALISGGDAPFLSQEWGDQPLVCPAATRSPSCWIGLLLTGTADSRGFQVTALRVLEQQLFTFSAILLGLRRPLGFSGWAFPCRPFCLNGFLLSQECCAVLNRTVFPPDHIQRGSPTSFILAIKAWRYGSDY